MTVIGKANEADSWPPRELIIIRFLPTVVIGRIEVHMRSMSLVILVYLAYATMVFGQTTIIVKSETCRVEFENMRWSVFEASKRRGGGDCPAPGRPCRTYWIRFECWLQVFEQLGSKPRVDAFKEEQSHKRGLVKCRP